MKGEDLYNGITEIRDDQIAEAGRESGYEPVGDAEVQNIEAGRESASDAEVQNVEAGDAAVKDVPNEDRKTGEKTGRRGHGTAGKQRRRRWTASIAAVLAVAVIAGVALGPWGETTSAYAIAQAEYPAQEAYSDTNLSAWFDMQDARQAQFEAYAGTLSGFVDTALPALLAGSETENRVCSPANVYMALSMLAEVTDGNSRAQILDLLRCDSIETVRTRAQALWYGNYIDDGTVTSLLANSLWLDEDVSFVQDTMQTLADVYYADSFRGQMGSQEMNRALQDWTNQHTGDRLTQQVQDLQLSPDTILALVSTIYYRARWAQEFMPDQTAPQAFHTLSGDVDVDFMHQTFAGTHYQGAQFSATSKDLLNGGDLWFFLPEEGVNPATLLKDGEVLSLLADVGNYDALMKRDGWSYIDQIHLSMPKFDVTCDMDLGESLQALGVTDIFDAATADFSPMVEDSSLQPYVSQAKHAARVTVDEEGLEAAAFTEIGVDGAGGPSDEPTEIDFVLDRPFLFAVTGDDGTPLFVGVVQQP